MPLTERRHLAGGIKAKVMSTSFLPLCPPLDVDYVFTVSIAQNILSPSGFQASFSDEQTKLTWHLSQEGPTKFDSIIN